MKKRIVWRLTASLAIVVCLPPPTQAQGPFADVPSHHWAYDAVNELAGRAAVNGYPDGSFGGDKSLTRYEYVTAFWRMIFFSSQGHPSVSKAMWLEPNAERKPELPLVWQVYERALLWPAHFDTQRHGQF
jgi:hypothetical protein